MTKTEKLTHCYRWRFLRLNKYFQHDSVLSTKAVKTIMENQELPENEKQQLISGLEDKLRRKYGINGIYDYRIENPPPELRVYDEMDFPVQKGMLEKIFTGKLNENQYIYKNQLLETISRPKKVKNRKGEVEIKDIPLITPKYVQVVINYDAALGNVHREIDRIIKPNQTLRRRELSIKRPKTHSETFIELYEAYLQVWELRSKGKYNKDVARIVFPKEDRRAAEDKASKYLKEAIALIKGGYRKITF